MSDKLRSSNDPNRRRRKALLAILLAVALVTTYQARTAVCSGLGHALAADDEPAAVDVIVVAVDAGPAGALEAADLVSAQIAPRVAVLADHLDLVDREFARRGVPLLTSSTVAVNQLRALGVQTVETIPTEVDGTTAEGEVLPAWLRHRGYRSVLVVASRDHARRVRRVLHRAMTPAGIRVLVRGARLSQFNPTDWCQTRGGLRAGIVETQKLLIDLVRHPLS